METVSSMTITPAEPAMVPASLRPSTSTVTSISSAVRRAAEEPPGTTALSLRPWGTPPACSYTNWRRVTDTGSSYTPGRATWPETEYMRVPPWVLVPRPANHAAPRRTMGGGGPEAPPDRRKGGLELRPALLALERGDQPRLFAADVGAGAPMDDDVQGEPRAPDVLSEEAGLIGVRDRPAEDPPGLDVLAADIHEGQVGADGVGGDDHALNQRVGISLEQVAILEGAG